MDHATSSALQPVGFTVVIPTYNSGRLVLETIESVVCQSRPADQIIVVDDGSTDDTAARIGEQFPQVTLVTTANRGRSAARNLGLARATQRWVCFLDHDDLWHRDKLAHTERYLAEHPVCRALRHPVWWFSATPDATALFGMAIDFVAANLDDCHRAAELQPDLVNDFAYLETQGRDVELMFERCLGITSATVIDRQLAIQAGGFPVYASGGEDWMFFLQVARFDEWHTLAEPLGFARFHAGQGTENRADAKGVLAVKVAAWFGGRPFPERRDLATIRRDLAGYGPSYAEEIHQHLKAALRARDLRAAGTIARLGALLLPKWRDRPRALLPARLRPGLPKGARHKVRPTSR